MRRVDADLLSINRIERRARLGVADDSLIKFEREYTDGIRAASEPTYVARRVSVSHISGGALIDGVEIRSEGLSRLLSGCKEGYILVGTLGFGVDRYLLAAATEPYRLYVADAISDCLIEALLDYAMAELGCKEELTNRFSPGYGDLDIAYGRVLVAMSGADKELGVRFTESGLMSPRKTVNAIIGIKD